MELKGVMVAGFGGSISWGVSNPFNGIERTGGFMGAIARSPRESIQWNWKSDTSLVAYSFKSSVNPFNGIESTQFQVLNAWDNPYIESIQWNWKVW